jgi:23S rRNA (guanosine2251-2'-O)-methyltransferase
VKPHILPSHERIFLEKALLKARHIESLWRNSKEPPQEELKSFLSLFNQDLQIETKALEKLFSIALTMPLDLELREFLNLVVPIERILDQSLSDSDFLVTTLDKEINTAPTDKLPLIFILDHLRSAFNVGSIFRLAETLQIQEIHLVGYTAQPLSPQVRKTAMGTELLTLSKNYDHLEDSILDLKSRGFEICALETVPNSTSIYQRSWPQKCALLVGNERFGIQHLSLQKCNQIRHIPLRGIKNSLNVSNALSITAFEWARQYGNHL